MKYSIVLPIKVLGRVATDRSPILQDVSPIRPTNGFILFKFIGLPSYRKFLGISGCEATGDRFPISGLHEFILIAPKKELPILEDLVFKNEEKIPFRLVAEETLLDRNISEERGWLKQQILKLAVSSIVMTDHYLVVDSDHFLTKPFGIKDIFQNDKVLYHTEPWQTENSDRYSVNSEWWINSATILNQKELPINGLMSVTPQVLITQVVKDLVGYVSNTLIHDPKNIDSTDAWQKFLCERNFTEFTLYWVFLLKTNRTNLYEETKTLWAHDHEVNVLRTECNKNKVGNALKLQKTSFSVIQGYIEQDLLPFIKEFSRFFEPKNSIFDAVFLTASMLIPNRQQSFSTDVRFRQTLDTLNSIKKRVPNSYTILIEGTKNLPESIRRIYEYHYDHVIYTDDLDISLYLDAPNIGAGEMKLLELGVDWLEKQDIKTEVVFKLGARYVLNDSFNINAFSKEFFSFKKKYDESVKSDVVITGLYSIPFPLLKEFKSVLQKGPVLLATCYPMIEQLFIEVIGQQKISFVETLGLEGSLSYNKQFFSV